MYFVNISHVSVLITVIAVYWDLFCTSYAFGKVPFMGSVIYYASFASFPFGYTVYICAKFVSCIIYATKYVR